ncbi:MAG TPA: tRNA (adenosine(37)-N6)-threonylcarbamoyltransferase complex dimerization subunit type 1 TsaB [Planctomycetota bacterium]
MELALETSRRETSLALAAGDRVLLDEGAAAHASDLLPRLAGLLAQAGIERAGPLGLARLFVGLGPGSYTGLRVGIATAHGLARATGAVLYGLSSFEALASAELAPGEEGVVVADARGGRAYVGRYRREGAALRVLAEPSACAPAELGARCAGATLVLGHPGLREALGLELPPDTRYREDALPRAGALLALGRARLAAGSLASRPALEPLYLAEFAARARP